MVALFGYPGSLQIIIVAMMILLLLNNRLPRVLKQDTQDGRVRRKRRRLDLDAKLQLFVGTTLVVVAHMAYGPVIGFVYGTVLLAMMFARLTS